MRNYTPCCVPPPNAREAAYLLPRHFQIWSPKYCSAGSPRTSRSNRGACISCSCPSPGSAASIASAFSWSLRLVLRNAMVAESGITWLMRILRTGTCSSLSDLARRALSLAAIIVGMATMMNSVDVKCTPICPVHTVGPKSEREESRTGGISSKCGETTSRSHRYDVAIKWIEGTSASAIELRFAELAGRRGAEGAHLDLLELVDRRVALSLEPKHALHRVPRLLQLLAQSQDLPDGGIQEVGEAEHPQRVAGGRGVEDDALKLGVLLRLQEGDHLADGHGFVNPWRRRVQQLTQLQILQLLGESAHAQRAENLVELLAAVIFLRWQSVAHAHAAQCQATG
mmetsp:Transcript_28959/g.74312  ORF Transcript_28959/g.74312 Transcript_28959/m.74312 type:complete len:341 (-) Transcript_28959:2173-3195(-)